MENVNNYIISKLCGYQTWYTVTSKQFTWGHDETPTDAPSD